MKCSKNFILGAIIFFLSSFNTTINAETHAYIKEIDIDKFRIISTCSKKHCNYYLCRFNASRNIVEKQQCLIIKKDIYNFLNRENDLWRGNFDMIHKEYLPPPVGVPKKK